MSYFAAGTLHEKRRSSRSHMQPFNFQVANQLTLGRVRRGPVLRDARKFRTRHI